MRNGALKGLLKKSSSRTSPLKFEQGFVGGVGGEDTTLQAPNRSLRSLNRAAPDLGVPLAPSVTKPPPVTTPSVRRRSGTGGRVPRKKWGSLSRNEMAHLNAKGGRRRLGQASMLAMNDPEYRRYQAEKRAKNLKGGKYYLQQWEREERKRNPNWKKPKGKFDIKAFEKTLGGKSGQGRYTKGTSYEKAVLRSQGKDYSHVAHLPG